MGDEPKETDKRKEKLSEQTATIAISADEQIALAEHRRQLAVRRYELAVQRGAAWSHKPRTAAN